MIARPISLTIIGEDDVYDTLLQQAVTQDANIIVQETVAYNKKLLSMFPLKNIPDVFIIIHTAHPPIQKVLDALHLHHPQVPIAVMGHNHDEEFMLLNEHVHAYLQPHQCKSYVKAIRIVAEKQHFTSDNFWKKHDLLMNHEQSGKAIDQMNKLPEELMAFAQKLAANPDATNEQLIDILHISKDRIHTKMKKLWLLLGLNGKKDLIAFLVQYFSKDE